MCIGIFFKASMPKTQDPDERPPYDDQSEGAPAYCHPSSGSRDRDDRGGDDGGRDAAWDVCISVTSLLP